MRQTFGCHCYVGPGYHIRIYLYIIMQKPSTYTDRSKGRKDGYYQIEYYQIEVWYAECLYMEGDATILCTMTNEPMVSGLQARMIRRIPKSIWHKDV